MGAWVALYGGYRADDPLWGTSVPWTYTAEPSMDVSGRLTIPVSATAAGSVNNRYQIWQWTLAEMMVLGTRGRNWAIQPQTDAPVWLPYVEVAMKPITWADDWELCFSWSYAPTGGGFNVGTGGQVRLIKQDNAGVTRSAFFGNVGTAFAVSAQSHQQRNQPMVFGGIAQSPTYGWDSAGATETLIGGQTNLSTPYPSLYLNNIAATAATTLICDLKIRCWGNDSLPT